MSILYKQNRANILSLGPEMFSVIFIKKWLGISNIIDKILTTFNNIAINN